MRIRSTKPEFWKSRLITSVSWDARLVLKGLESYVDDNGVGIDDIELIVTDVFPRDMFANGRETVARVSEAIAELHRAGLVWRYEGESDHLLYISFWESVQRIDKPGRGRNPRPDGTLEYKDSEIRESVASPPVTLAPGTEEQRNRGTGEQGNRNPPNPPEGERAKRGGRIPADWEPSPELIAQMSHEAPLVDLRAEHLVFVDYWIAQPGQRGVKLDWEATWRNWMRRKQSDRATGKLTPTERAQQTATAGRQVAGRQITSLDPKEVTA